MILNTPAKLVKVFGMNKREELHNSISSFAVV